MSEVLAAFTGATQLNALNLAGSLLVLSAGVGGVLTIAWLFATRRIANTGGWGHAPQAMLLIIMAFLFLLIVLGVLYD